MNALIDKGSAGDAPCVKSMGTRVYVVWFLRKVRSFLILDWTTPLCFWVAIRMQWKIPIAPIKLSIRLPRLIITVWFLLLFPLTTGAWGSEGIQKPVVKNGILDIRKWGNEPAGLIPLEGQWDFYWLTTYEDLIKSTALRKSMNVPGLWSMSEDRPDLSPQGFACYQLKVLREGGQQGLAIVIPDVYTSYRFYINGKPVAENGKTGLTAKNTVPGWRPQWVMIEPGSDTLDLVWEVSNFHHAKGGIGKAPMLGTVESIAIYWWKLIIGACSQAIVLFTLSLFFVIFFFFYKRWAAFLFYSLFCLVWGIRALFSDYYLGMLVWPDIPWIVLVRMEYLTLSFGMASALCVLKSIFRGCTWVLADTVFFSIFAGYAMVMLFSTPLFFTRHVGLYLVTAGFLSVYAIVVVIQALLLKRAGAVYVAWAILAFCLNLIYEIMAYFKVIELREFILNALNAILLFLLAGGLIKVAQHRKAQAENEKNEGLLKTNVQVDELKKAHAEILNINHALQDENKLKSGVLEKIFQHKVYLDELKHMVDNIRAGSIERTEKLAHGLQALQRQCQKLATLFQETISVYQVKGKSQLKNKTD